MNNPISIPTVVASLLIAHPLAAQQPTTPSPPAVHGQQVAPTPEEVDKQFTKLQEQMAKMNEQMSKLQETKDPQARQLLLREHWTTMQSAMAMMHGMMGGGMMGGGMTGSGMMSGHMMGGPMMMWPDYRNLTPEQLKQRQYMMDRWMPMQQMMMYHMMQQQNWLSQSPPAAPSKK
nr:A28 [uncultured bacterium]